MINRIRLINFKSFVNETIDLSHNNVIIGNNASGKSNLIDAFKLVSDAFKYGLDNAYYLHGGFNSVYSRIKNQNESQEKTTEIEVEFGLDDSNQVERYYSQSKKSKSEPVTLTLNLYFRRKGNYDLQRYVATVSYTYIDSKGNQTGSYVVKIDFNDPKRKYFSFEFNNVDASVEKEIRDRAGERFSLRATASKNKKDLYPLTYLVSNFTYNSFGLYDFSNNAKFFNFNSSLVKSSTKLAGEEINEDGSNFSYVLRDILKSSKRKNEYLTLVKKLLPTLEAFETQIGPDGQLSTKFKEINSEFIAGHSMSDGTAYMLALIASISSPVKGRTLLYEEPDRYLHPALSRQLVGIFDDVARSGSQVIVTTHNQEFLRHTDPSSVKILRKNEEGLSEVIDLIRHPKYKKYLDRGASLDNLFINNVLK